MSNQQLQKSKRTQKPYELVFYPSDTQDPETFAFSDLAAAQRYLFSRQPAVNDDAEIQVFNTETKKVIGGYFYRMNKSGKWELIRALEVA